MLEDVKILSLLLIVNINSLFIGYLLGRYVGGGVIHSQPPSFFTKNKDSTTTNNDLSIDNKKIVVNIKTDNLERKFDSLGDVKKTEENISNSVNKLKNLKG